MFVTRVLSVLLSVLVFYLFSTMSDPAPPTPKLEVRLKSPSIPTSFSPPIAVSVQLSVLNTADSPATLLNWGSPLDPRANILGVFEIRDTDTDEVVSLDTIKFSRKLPPPREDLVQISAGGAVDAEVTLPRVPLVEGRQYSIRAKGWWQAVWEKSLEDVPSDDLEKLTGAERGGFESEAVPIVLDA
ncbi:hypothetical protein BDV12DRAFT_171883 [Aspergillus spectabilis]